VASAEAMLVDAGGGMGRRSGSPVAHNTENRELWTTALHEGMVAGTLASVLSTAVLSMLGRRQARGAAAPLNAVSHWLWGDDALREDRPSWKYTLPGALTQHAASILWAALYSRVYGHRPEAKQLPQAIAGGVATSATAYVIDYTITPKRLTPGYEHRLDGMGMLAVYTALAAGFAAGALLLAAKEDGASVLPGR
jgi:hypothetical protein